MTTTPITKKKLGRPTIDIAERMAKNVQKKENGCWIWIGSVTHLGYGNISWNGVIHSAHRVSYELNKGPIPKGKHILHTCDNPLCVNPDHLRAGTAKENMTDKMKKGRHVKRGKKKYVQLEFQF